MLPLGFLRQINGTYAVVATILIEILRLPVIINPTLTCSILRLILLRERARGHTLVSYANG